MEGTLSNEVEYTGCIRDDTTDFTYMNARYYEPSGARFLTPDSYTGNPYNPNTQNVYSYTGGNPVNYTDPTGHFAIVAAAVTVGIVILAAAVIMACTNTQVEAPPSNLEMPNPARDLLVGLLLLNFAPRVFASDNSGDNATPAGMETSSSTSGNPWDPKDGKKPENPKKVDKKYLEENGIDPHKFKKDILGGNADISRYNIFIDKIGDIWLQMNGSKEFIYTYENIENIGN